MILLALTPLALVACDADPMDRPGTLRAAGVNDTNLRAMVVNPAELQSGAAAADARGAAAASAVELIVGGKPRELMNPRATDAQ
jgi:hypothetical protein